LYELTSPFHPRNLVNARYNKLAFDQNRFVGEEVEKATPNLLWESKKIRSKNKLSKNSYLIKGDARKSTNPKPKKDKKS